MYVIVSIETRIHVRKYCMEISVRLDTLLWLLMTETQLCDPLFSLLLDLISRWNSFSTYPRS
jgi:hypothetical protein